MASFMTDLWSSVFTPGTTPTLLIATNATFAALQVLLLALLFATYSIHFAVLSGLCGALWWSINWFVAELDAAKANEARGRRDLSQSATEPLNRPPGALDTSESETETESIVGAGDVKVSTATTTALGNAAAARKPPPSLLKRESTPAAPNQPATQTVPEDRGGELRQRNAHDSSGYVSTDSEQTVTSLNALHTPAEGSRDIAFGLEPTVTTCVEQQQRRTDEWHPSAAPIYCFCQVCRGLLSSYSIVPNGSRPSFPAMFPNVPLSIGRKRVFDSVFPPVPLSSIPPKPDATSIPSSIRSPAQQQSALPSSHIDAAPEQATWDRAWHTATAFLSIPDKKPSYCTASDEISDECLFQQWPRETLPSQSVIEALCYVGSDSSIGKQLRAGSKECDLQEWSDFSRLLAEELATEGGAILGIHADIRSGTGSPQPHDHTLENEGRGDSMDLDQTYSMSYRDWKNEVSSKRRISMMTEGEDGVVTAARHRLLRLLEDVQSVGLGGSKAQKVFAEVMNNLITEFVNASYAGEWEAPSFVLDHLRQWIENVFARLVVQVLDIFTISEDEDILPDELIVTLNDVEKWQEIGLARLGALRISELFEIIVEWDASSGAIEDLKHYITSPSTRFYLTSAFAGTLMNRLLHPGASTIDILQVYISIIHAFTQLDPRGVLLDRLARPIRRYLRERDDTVKVIVSGLLANTDPDGEQIPSVPDALGELAVELSKAHQLALQEGGGELDWDDMNWIPDPIDAAADYKKSKHSDVIGSLVSLFESKEVFVKELQRVLSDRLLKKKRDYDLEISVLELLKLRFGESALQACDVMMRDVVDSKRVDTVIRADQNLGSLNGSPHEEVPEIHAKILSRLFWPSLSDQNFKVPEEIASLQARYSAGFETLKPSRKLTWLNSLGSVTVELDLTDRFFSDEVTPWQASVIYAFQSCSPSSTDSPVTKSVSELAEELEMSPSLVRSACLFWLSKRILAESALDIFSVLETLPDNEESVSQPAGVGAQPGDKTTNISEASAAAAAAEAEAARESAEAAAMEKMNVYWQFIVGMLTNQGAMPLQRIIMMLKIAVPGGFPFSSEELKEFLGKMVAKGKLEMLGGGNYKIIGA
ncbi:conserved hypothetical protein [Uncinocarpus reesii 1704]|uniref:Anaphase-promoting complex subunit 2 n=1 Tax=Uncinocarpus reesii (strain UAMH 1704) TaxID=336963 RepID=C4JFH7_UNCRE|nr:uncharacterized protein UREG_00991 [Uncinocarpus reesii 1704]EEP76142.1 conserved hypothetical protein [Uncinocarpus reesii 1704]